MYKLIVFVPVESIDKFKDELFKAGAGRLGEYSHCCFETKGIGQFMPLTGSNPTVGQQYKIERVEEIKFETIVEKKSIENVLTTLYQAHPYEEPAFDLIELANHKFNHLKNLANN